MRILFLVKYYQPFDRGGSEWSTHDLAKLLVNKGNNVTILTPNYGSKTHEFIEGIEVQRFPFIRLLNPKGTIAPFWSNNLIFFMYTSLLCIYWALKKNVQVIHAHNNEFIPATAITSSITRKPSVVTFRDYQSLCNLGFCLWAKDKTCNLRQFVEKDFDFFWQNYVSGKNVLKYIALLAAALRARLMQKTIYYFAKRISYKITVSQKVAQIFKANGVKETATIHNPIIISTNPSKKSNNEILYVGKFSKGKGVELMLEVIPKILKEIPSSKFKLIGSGYLEKKFKDETKRNHMTKRVTFTGQIDHERVLSEIRKGAFIVVPSMWPEPLPRSALETLLSGTPIVATDVGGINEVIKDDIYGVVTKPDADSLEKAIKKAYERKEIFKKNILKDLQKLRKHFTQNVLLSYQKIYQSAISQ